MLAFKIGKDVRCGTPGGWKGRSHDAYPRIYTAPNSPGLGKRTRVYTECIERDAVRL